MKMSLCESQSILEYSNLERVIVTPKNPGVFKTHTIRDVHLENYLTIIHRSGCKYPSLSLTLR